ncbi:hypothetical protein B0A49_00435 [Cryomyces minteri]|uniref:RRM domain-containing protein n=1 Tax=Cryomyces minteri TaxID=331657 RepID=A0A4U0XWK3_9PEZI|nr:hypothetical protein B0A49_00435 [Cryomyces minteri]
MKSYGIGDMMTEQSRTITTAIVGAQDHQDVANELVIAMELGKATVAYDTQAEAPTIVARTDAAAAEFGRPIIGGIFCFGVQIKRELEDYHDVGTLEDVRVIRDKQTGVSRQFGFLRFRDIQGARAFVERNYPMISLYGFVGTSEDVKATEVRIAFSRERDGRDRDRDRDRDRSSVEAEWTCRKSELEMPPISTAHGDHDSGDAKAPTQFLLVRSLQPSTTEQVLANGIAKLYKSSRSSSTTGNDGSDKPLTTYKGLVSTTSGIYLGAPEGSIKRVLLVRDRRTNKSWGYGFVEFHRVEDAKKALDKFNAQKDFTISSKPVIVSYIHAGVFMPLYGSFLRDPEQYSFASSTDPSVRLRYRDADAYVSELVVSTGPPDDSRRTTGATVITTNPATMSAMKETSISGGLEAPMKPKKRKAEAESLTSSKKTLPAHLQLWTDRAAELRGLVLEPGYGNEASSASDPATATAAVDDVTPAAPAQSFADLTKLCCYLCSRQFKSESAVQAHEARAEMHQENLKDAALVAKALVKLGKPASAAVEYRDRAKERRMAHMQPARPTTHFPQKGASPAEKAGGSSSSEPPPLSKGASLLGKVAGAAGYVAGSGLGAGGTGMVAPVAAAKYAEGVGLGAEGGKVGDAVEEASKSTVGGFAAFSLKGKEKARERFARM